MYYILSLLLMFSLVVENIEIKNSWVRPAAKGSNSALYFEVHNNSDAADTLYKVTSNVAKIVEVHKTYKRADRMGMRKTEYVVIKPNSVFKFKPRAHHVMLIDLNEKLLPTQKKEFTLYFKQAGKVKIKTEVKLSR